MAYKCAGDTKHHVLLVGAEFNLKAPQPPFVDGDDGRVVSHGPDEAMAFNCCSAHSVDNIDPPHSWNSRATIDTMRFLRLSFPAMPFESLSSLKADVDNFSPHLIFVTDASINGIGAIANN